jgi:hypothetical protein
MLQGIKGMAIVGIEALTDARANKFARVSDEDKAKGIKRGTPNPFGTIHKLVRTTGFVGVDYEASVNREASRQGGTASFDADPLPWGEWLIPSKVITHKGNLYLRTQTTPGTRRKVACKVLSYRGENGQFLSREQVKPYLPEAKESNKQQEETGITETVWVRTYAFNSIQKIRINSQTYKLIQ